MIHLHTRSSYSLLESPLRIEEIVNLAKEAGQSSVVLTDHNTMFGTMEFLKASQKAGLKPIVGLEFEVLYQNQRIPLLALAKNTEGLQALFQISTLLCGQKEWVRLEKGSSLETSINMEETKQGMDSSKALTDPVLPFEDLLSLSAQLILMNAGGDDDFETMAKMEETSVAAFFQALGQNGAEVAVAISLQDSPAYKETHLRTIALKNNLRPIALSRIEYAKESDVQLLTLLRGIS